MGEGGRKLWLASRSPRRAALLEQVGYRFAVVDVEVDESGRDGEAAVEFVERLAIAKARAGAGLPETGGGVVLAADTVVVVDGARLSKPRDRADGIAMLGRLGGRWHEVLTAVALADGDRLSLRTHRARVAFRKLRDGEAAAYWATGEPADKAGGYAIQGCAALFVSDLAGSHSGVMGLPLFETGELLAAAGIEPEWRR